MPDGISVAEALRQAAAIAKGHGGLFFTRHYLIALARELEPDYVENNPARDAVSRMGFEAIGFNRGGYLGYCFYPRDGFDRYNWALCYDRGYRAGRFAVPAPRPRIRMAMRRG